MKTKILITISLIILCFLLGCIGYQYSSINTSSNSEEEKIISNVIVEGTYNAKEWGPVEIKYGICRLIDCRWITQIGISQKSITLKDLSYHGSQVYALPTNRRIRAFGELHMTTHNGSYFVADSLDILK